MDGRALFYRRHGFRSPLVALTLEGGSERTMVECVFGDGNAFGVAADGLYYIECESEPGLHRLDLSSGRDEHLGSTEDPWGQTPVAVSPDGQTGRRGRVPPPFRKALASW